MVASPATGPTDFLGDESSRGKGNPGGKENRARMVASPAAGRTDVVHGAGRSAGRRAHTYGLEAPASLLKENLAPRVFRENRTQTQH